MLELKGLSKRFGALKAVNKVSFALADTGISGLIGPNGSGKTTLFHMITGFYKPDAGDVLFKGEPITGIAPHEISRKGIVRTFQQTRVLPFMSVMDNLLAAAPDQMGEHLLPLFLRPSKVKAQEEAHRQKAKEVLDTIELARLQNDPAGGLSYGQQKLLEIGRVLMADPAMIILDEPTAGINPSLIRRLTEILKRLRDKGIKIFLIEHNMPLVSELCDEIFVMDSGKFIFSGAPDEVQTHPRVVEAYLGREN